MIAHHRIPAAVRLHYGHHMRDGLAIALLLLAGCAAETPDASPTSDATDSVASAPSRPAAPTFTPSPSASPTPTLGPAGVAMVVTTDLVVRSEPAISDTSSISPDSLDAPMLLYVVDGPVAADGYDWYLVKPFHADYLPHGDELVMGPADGLGRRR